MSKYETNESAADHYEGPRCSCTGNPEDGPCRVCERRMDEEDKANHLRDVAKDAKALREFDAEWGAEWA